MALIDESWTGQQKQAIEAVDRSVLVGAAAGSGKTAVLARRCAYLVSEASPERRCDLDELLVVTFTEAAASEMRSRIGQALRSRLAEAPNDARLRYQLAALDAAQISTIHSFCRTVLNRWFAVADLDPDFDLLDADEQLLLQQEAVEQVFAELYEDTGDRGARFRELVDVYGEGRDHPIADRVIWLAEYLNSLVDPQGWLSRAGDWLSVPRSGDLPADLASAVCHRICRELRWQQRDCLRAVELIRGRYKSAAYVADVLQGHADRLDEWVRQADPLSPGTLGALTSSIRDYEFPSKRGGPRLPKDAPEALRAERERAGEWHERVRDAFRSRLQKRWCQFTVAEMVQGLARAGPFVDSLIELVRRFGTRYGRLKERDGRLDFADLERKTLDLLEARAGDNEVARSLRKRFRYVCVDEFQDVNPVQERIVRLVSGETSTDRPDNLFCVGDVKQSIYRFRLAEPNIFTERQERFRSDPAAGRFISLGDNFRSRAGVLDGVNAVFERLMTGQVGPIVYDADARLRPGLVYLPNEPGAPCVETHLLERKLGPAAEGAASTRSERLGEDLADWEAIEREAYWVGRRILQLMGREDGARRAMVCVKPSAPGEPMGSEPIDFRHMVVLLRSRRHKAEHMARVLARMGVPVHADLATGYFDSTEVRDLLALLDLLDNRQQDIPLAAVMRSPLFAPRFDENDLVRVRTIDRECPFHEAFERYARQGDGADLAERCASLSRMLDRYRKLARRQPLAEALWQIYAETGCLAYVAGLPGGRQRRANLIKLHERARQFGTFARQGVYRFLHFIRQLEERGRDLGAALPASESDNVVRIMSIHAAKGLEFPVVVLPDLAKGFNFEDARGRLVASREYYLGPKVVDDQQEIEYPTVAHALASDDAETQTRAEEMRILYVAMTRARERLILVGTAPLQKVGPDRLAAEWAGHVGPLPPLTLSSADSYLDWLGPALASQSKSQEDPLPGWLRIVAHPAEEIRAWELPGRLVAEERERRRRYADLAPLPPDEPDRSDGALVQRVLRRLRLPYRHDDLTAIPSVLAVTELKRRYDATRELDDQTRQLAYSLPRGSLSSEGKRGVQTPSPEDQVSSRDLAAERGRATHLLLQHADLGAAVDPDRLDSEIEDLVGRRLLSRAQAGLIDREAVGWFLRTRLGRVVRQAGEGLRREVMFTSCVAPEMFDPAVRAADRGDVVLIRGIIDALLVGRDECQIIDYKTDRIGKDELPARAESYRLQMDLYARAAHQLTCLPVTHRWLVFLEPRQVFEFR